MKSEVCQENEIDDAFEVVIDEIHSLNRVYVDLEDIDASVNSRDYEDEVNDVDIEDELDETLVDYCDSEDGSKRSNKFADDSNDDN
ncbi:hypothetical protein M5689_003239 [Euphorbia peplus]|nr:hypothetical protein M5689_003239 [Euphorbia peplus]